MFKRAFQHVVFGVLAIAIVVLPAAGCNTDSSQQDNGQESSSLPKQSFHKPDGFAAAVDRLKEIAAAVQSDDELPPPIQFKIREVIHGSGAGAHSHFYLADEEQRDDHGHTHEESSEKLHDLEVDVFTELKDIVKWLPEIAGDGDMEESAWNQVNEISTSFGELLENAVDGKSEDQLRDAINSEEQSINEFIDRLSSLS
ncbi:MAG: hypothetical protein AAF456_19525 [Planctomycetota bacterium]